MTPDQVALIPLLPLLGFVIAGLLGRKLGRAGVSIVCCGTMLGAFLLSVALFVGYQGESATVVAYEWIQAGSLSVPVAFLVDPLSLVMLLVVTGVGSLIHIYSTSYMQGDEGYHRYFAYLNLFVFFMLVLVTADSLPLMFVGWEGVGLCSYLLIGFWYQKPSAADAGLKAFLVNRVGDFGFLVAMLIAFATMGTLSFSGIAAAAPGLFGAGGATALRAIALCLFLAAAGKSAQIPLYIWLPDAMEGPTPVSALIHAATMVTSGVYVVARLNTLYALVPEALAVVAIVGAATACFAASMGLVARDIKKVLAYSTISQLGYMFLALGVGATSAGLFHLVTHAFFKACLFLGAGAVMHALGNETDLWKMGGLRRKIPITWIAMLFACLAIVGFPGMAGFVSKDAILLAAYESHSWVALALGIVTIGLTSFYMFRLYFLAFHGEPREARLYDHAHDATPAMAVALVPLAALSLVGGWLNWPHAFGGGTRFAKFLEPVLRLPAGVAGPGSEGHAPMTLAGEVAFSAVCAAPALVGFLLALAWYRRPSTGPVRLAAALGPVHRLLTQKWYVDEIYAALVVAPVVSGARFLWRVIDEIAIDGTVKMVGIVSEVFGEVLRAFQSGFLRSYALALTLGAASVLVWMVL